MPWVVLPHVLKGHSRSAAGRSTGIFGMIRPDGEVWVDFSQRIVAALRVVISLETR